ncbi:AI-2E family transporter [Paracoccus yeei]|uniref:AI-2E family transporter n=1 Tax=Paracoccus yeei TaxID=147645 RepID=A0A5P2QM70_9RHOB|nr:AI-2E family transporter [Paracoccus yeei]QEU07068.1 AI-2E family transporter [Paracoccus yeei]
MESPVTPGPQPDIVRLAAWFVTAAAILSGLYLGQDVLIPLAIAFLISFALSPLVVWLCRRGLPRVLSVIVVMATVVTVILGLGVLVGSQVRLLAVQLPTYQSTVRDKIDALGDSMRGPGIFDGAWQMVTTVQEEVEKAIAQNEESLPAERVQVVAQPESPFRTAVAWLVPVLAPVATAGIVLVFVFLALLDRGDLRDRLIRMLGGNLHRSTDAMEEAGSRISKYLLMQLVVNVTYAIPMAAGLWLIGVPGWILWGTLAAVMRFIPYVGPVLSAVFPLALAFAVDPGWNMVLLTLALVVILELISSNIVEPVLYGTSTGLSALSLIAAATFWTALWGPVGLILSTPLTVCLLVIGRNLPQLQFLDTLLGSTPVLDVPTRIYQRLIADDPQEAIEIASEAIDDSSVIEFYDSHGIEVLRQASVDFLTQARAEHRLRVVNGMDVLLDDLREDYTPPDPPQGPPRVACIGGKWEIDNVACEMMVHALAFGGIAASQRPAGVLTARYVDKLDLEGVELVCLSYFSREPMLSARSFCRRLRNRWPEVKIVLALWNAPDDLTGNDKAREWGADAVVASMSEAVQRIEQMLTPDLARERQTAPRPENDAERVAALEATNVLDGHAREELDALAARAAEVFDVEFAVITAIDADHEFIIGQSMELPGEVTQDGTNMITLPREDAVCDHVISTDSTLVIKDTRRDPRFADLPAITMWRTRFYAGAPLRTADGLVLGALCLLDTQPRALEEEEMELLRDMADDVAALITGEDAAEHPEESETEENSATTAQPVPK